MIYQMLINWRCGAYYPEGSVQDFSKLPSGAPPVPQEAIDYAVSQGYMIAIETPTSATTKK